MELSVYTSHNTGIRGCRSASRRTDQVKIVRFGIVRVREFKNKTKT